MKKASKTIAALSITVCLAFAISGCTKPETPVVEEYSGVFSEEVVDEAVEVVEQTEEEVEEVQDQVEQEIEVQEEPMNEVITYYDDYSYQDYYVAPSYNAPSGGSGTLNSYDGINYYNGNKETYYSSNVLYHYMTPQWTLREDGVWTDSEGYVVVASSDLAYGSTVDTSLGMGKVYDSGCASGVVDVYTAW